nr:hypothetical protein [Mycobacterium lepromatosis]
MSRNDVDGFYRCTTYCTPSEYLAINHIGLTDLGESWKAIAGSEIEICYRLPINPRASHPVEESGVRMPLDAASRSTVRPMTTTYRTQRVSLS